MDKRQDSFRVCIDVHIRPCVESDLGALEWFGMFVHDRALIRSVFEQHRRGEALMLVVEANGETSGQVWIELRTHGTERVGVIWALRVLPPLQRRGIGMRLIAAAEAMLLEREFERVELAVETDNVSARRLYERLGYRYAGVEVTPAPPGSQLCGVTQVILAKPLGVTARAAEQPVTDAEKLPAEEFSSR